MAATRKICLILCLLTVGIGRVNAQTRRQDVDLLAPDGVHLKATYFDAGRPGPGVFLFHMCGGADRHSWDHLASRLAVNGVHVLTLDYRGFGESGGPRYESLDPKQQRALRAIWARDLDLAFAYLVAQRNVDGAHLGAGGASCGANNSVDLAVRHSSIKSLVLLSGTTNQAGLKYIQQSDWLPILAVASDNDDYFVPYLRWLISFSSNPQSKFLQYRNAGHGTDMLSAEEELEPQIVHWFVHTLREATIIPARAATPPANTADMELWRTLTQPGGVDRVRPALEKMRGGHLPFPLYALDSLGREHVAAGDVDGALAIFKMNQAAYPNSPIVEYALANAYVEIGAREPASQHFEAALRLLDQDAAVSADTREFIRQKAEENLARLRSAPHRP